jgi:hypothetical protein
MLGTFFLYLVSQHPEVEAQIVAELDAAELLATPARLQPRRMGYDDIGRLPYLKNCIKEALRMYPPVGVGQVRAMLSLSAALHCFSRAAGSVSAKVPTKGWVGHAKRTKHSASSSGQATATPACR